MKSPEIVGVEEAKLRPRPGVAGYWDRFVGPGASAVAASAAGLVLDHRLGRSSVAPWFAPVYYTKLLIGHAAGSIWNSPSGPEEVQR